MFADQALRSVVHRLSIELARHPPGALLLQRKIGAAVNDAIEIVAFDRREASVEVIGGAFRRKHRDRLRAQMKIHRIADVVGIPFLAEIDVRHLTQRMDTGVGASRAVHDECARR